MSKNILLLFSVLLTFNLQAQQLDETEKRALEREVKTSGNYLYGEAVADTKDEAVSTARTILVSEINKEILNHHDWQFAKTIQAKEVDYYSETIDLMRGNKFRVIAYIKKDNLTALFDNKMPGVELPEKTTNPQATPITAAQSVEETVPPISQPIIASGDLLEQIVNASSMYEIQKILLANKRKGKVAYGKMDKLLNQEAAYFIVYKQSGEIVAILDKGSNSFRRDLISGEIYGKEIRSNNQIIWFQLFK